LRVITVSMFMYILMASEVKRIVLAGGRTRGELLFQVERALEVRLTFLLISLDFIASASSSGSPTGSLSVDLMLGIPKFVYEK
jgi:hypothetical protein